MSESSISNQPFHPEAAPPVRAGCSRFALIGCGGLLLLLLVGVGVFLLKAKEITLWGFDLMEKQVMARLPAETTDAEARRVREGFDAVARAVEDETIEPNAMNKLQPVMMRFADPNTNPRPEDVARLIELLEAAAGVTPAAESRPERAPPEEPVAAPVP